MMIQFKTDCCLKCQKSSLKYSEPITLAEAEKVGDSFSRFALCNDCGFVMIEKGGFLHETPAEGATEMVALAAEKLLSDNEKRSVRYSYTNNSSDAKPLPEMKPAEASIENETDSERRKRVIKEAEKKASAARQSEPQAEPAPEVASEPTVSFTEKVYRFFKSIFKR